MRKTNLKKHVFKKHVWKTQKQVLSNQVENKDLNKQVGITCF